MTLLYVFAEPLHKLLAVICFETANALNCVSHKVIVKVVILTVLFSICRVKTYWPTR